MVTHKLPTGSPKVAAGGAACNKYFNRMVEEAARGLGWGLGYVMASVRFVVAVKKSV